MNKYFISFWSAILYKEVNLTLLAQNEQSIKEFLEDSGDYSEQFRVKNGKDTLQFTILEEEIKFPYKLD